MNDDFDHRPEYPPIDETEDACCRAMWKAAMVQALIDAVGTSSTSGGKLVQAQTLRWLNATGKAARDFDMVCDLADLDPELLRKRFKELLEAKCSVGLKCLKKPKLQNRGSENRKHYFKRSRRRDLIKAARAKSAPKKKAGRGQ